MLNRVLFVILVTLCTLLGCRAEGVPYFKGTVYEALEFAGKQQKLLMVEFYAPWNSKSRWMAENVIARKDVYSVIDESFVLVRVDTKTKDGATLALQYEVSDYPSIVVFNVSGTVIDKIDKTLDRQDFLTRLSQIQLENDGRSGWELRKIFSAAQNNDRLQADKLTKDYLLKGNPALLISPVHMELFTNSAITFYGSAAFEYLKANRADFNRAFTQIVVNDLIHKVCLDAIFPYAVGAYEYDSIFVSQFVDSLNIVSQPFVCKQLASLARYRASLDLDGYISTVNSLMNSIDDERLSRLILSLEIVVTNGTIDQKHAARQIVEKFGRSTNSLPELQQIDALTKKLSE